ncbi:hypothetical protein ACINLE_18920 [Bacillus sp. z60-18]|uniref:hypothetical protein n=1 Tax=unclassified Bacillus (in: firmicutes) TaxID=185979 RepID=UPI002409F753|nr:hypothetical protein [Bacillus sp. HSf4]WFA07093.1 hypothetical protein P3X63_10145 [Bacillus sp. HSf4]
MSKEFTLEKFKYFLECYFNPSMDFSDIRDLAEDYRKDESDNNIKMFLYELHEIKNNEQWNAANNFIREHGMRNLNQKQIKQMVDTLIKVLNRD